MPCLSSDESLVPVSACDGDLQHTVLTNITQGGTKTVTGCSTHQSYAKGGCTASVVLQKLQWKLPEGVERTSLNALHDVEDRGGLHRKQN